MYRSVLYERSPYAVNEADPSCGCWSWATVLDVLQRADEGGARPELSVDVQRPGAAIGLAVGIAFRQLALLHEDVGFQGWPPMEQAASAA